MRFQIATVRVHSSTMFAAVAADCRKQSYCFSRNCRVYKNQKKLFLQEISLSYNHDVNNNAFSPQEKNYMQTFLSSYNVRLRNTVKILKYTNHACTTMHKKFKS